MMPHCGEPAYPNKPHHRIVILPLFQETALDLLPNGWAHVPKPSGRIDERIPCVHGLEIGDEREDALDRRVDAN
jgi:hypothetical protein